MAGSNKEQTYEQAAAAQQKAVRFLRDVVGDPDKADEIESLTVEGYADRRGLVLSNPTSTPNPTHRRKAMSVIYYNNPATGENEPVDLSTLPKGELLAHAEKLADSLGAWENAGSRIGDAVLDFEKGELDASELADEVWAALVEVDPNEYEADEDEAEEAA